MGDGHAEKYDCVTYRVKMKCMNYRLLLGGFTNCFKIHSCLSLYSLYANFVEVERTIFMLYRTGWKHDIFKNIFNTF